LAKEAVVQSERSKSKMPTGFALDDLSVLLAPSRADKSNCFAVSSNNRSSKMSDTLLENPQVAARKSARLTRARRAAILKALADPRRFELLERIAKAACPLGCAQARAALPISAATLSHHIKELETAGLISIRREGKFHYMSLRPGVLDALATALASLEQAPCGPR
jgi:ArsR family transcriptional regulator